MQLYPYASVYLGAEGKLGGEARDRIAGFWRALRMEPPPEPDNLAVLLALYASLLDLEAVEPEPARRALRTESCRALLWEHMLTWLPAFLHRLQGLPAPAYRAWAGLVERALLEEAARLPAPPAVPLHLRDAPGLADPRQEGGQAFLESLLAPARCGFIVLRADLAAAAAELGLALRQGERRYTLNALLGQDGPATLSWLARLAGSWALAHGELPASLDPVKRFWSGRAAAAAGLLRELAASEAP